MSETKERLYTEQEVIEIAKAVATNMIEKHNSHINERFNSITQISADHWAMDDFRNRREVQNILSQELKNAVASIKVRDAKDPKKSDKQLELPFDGLKEVTKKPVKTKHENDSAS